MLLLRRTLICLILAGLVVPVAAQEQARDCDFGLVLSGGGARGAAHVGVLQVLEENGIRPDCLTGASMGAIVGALYAAGFRLEEINELIGSLNWRNIYTEPINRASLPIMHRLEQEQTALRLGFDGNGLQLPRGILHDGALNHALIETLAPAAFAAGRDFDRLPIPFRAVGTDLRTGDRVVLRDGDLALAIRASMSVPLAYAPVERDGALLVDGGLVDNMPVGLARDMGAEFILAVDVQTPIDPDVKPDIVGVTTRIIDLLFDSKNAQHYVDPDLLVRPELDDHSFSDYSNLEVLIQRGRAAAEAVLDQIPAQYRSGRPQRAPSLAAAAFGDRILSRIDVTGNEYLSDRFLVRESELRVGRPFEFHQALRALDHLYATALVQGAWIDLHLAEDNSIIVEIRVIEQVRNTADVGLAYQSDDQVQGFLRLETRDPFGGGERLQLNTFASARDLKLGVALRGEQLFGAHFGYTIAVEHHEERPRFWQDREFINRAEYDRNHIRIGIDLPLGRSHIAEAGVLFGSVNIQQRLGLPYEPRTEKKRLAFGRYTWDTLDSLTHPRRGLRLRASGELNEASFGATSSYWRLDATLRLARGIGPAVLDVRARYGFSSGDLPVSEWFIIGGPELIPGVAREEFWGKQAAAGSLAIGFDPVSVVRVYGRFGLGGVWEQQGDIGWSQVISGFGVGTTVATPVGPVQLDYGWAEGGRNRLYVGVGWQK